MIMSLSGSKTSIWGGSVLFLLFALLPQFSFGQNSCSGSITDSNIPETGWQQIGDGTSGYVKVCITSNGMDSDKCGGTETQVDIADGSQNLEYQHTWEMGKACYIVSSSDGYANLQLDCWDGSEDVTVDWTTVNSNGVGVCSGNSCSSDSDCPTDVSCSSGLCQYCPTPSCSGNDCITGATTIDQCGTNFDTKTDGQTGYNTQNGNGDLDCDGTDEVGWTMDNSLYYTFCPGETGDWQVDISVSNCQDKGVQAAAYQGTPGNLHTEFYDYSGVTGSFTETMTISSTTDCVYLVFDGVSSNKMPSGDNCDISVNLSCTNCGCTLPIELVSFDGKAKREGNLLEWKTASEQNNSHFIIERSPNGKDYKEIGKVEGSGHSVHPRTYSMMDREPLRGRNYYRLKQVDMNGKVHSYPTVLVNRKGAVVKDLRIREVFPNPVTEGELNLAVEAAQLGEVGIKVYDRTGRVVQKSSDVLKKGLNKLQLDIGDLSQGFYSISLQKKGYGARDNSHFVIEGDR